MTVFFALDGFLFGNWVVCVPQVKAHIGASSGGLGIALLGISAGAVVTMVATGRLCTRFGSGPITVLAATLMSIAVMLPAQMTSVAGLAGVLLAFGAGFGALNVAVNSIAVDITGRVGRPIMPSFHAAFSLGGLAGALVGGVLASVLSTSWHLTSVGLFGLVVTASAGAMLLRVAPAFDAAPGSAAERRDTRKGASESGARRARALVAMFGLIALCSAYGEGALADWGTLHLHDDLHTSVGLAATGYASFSAAMVVGRLSGTWMLGRAGRTWVLAGGASIAAIGMLAAAIVPVLAVAIIGFVLVGLGLANMFPAAIGQAGALSGPSGVAAASTIGYFGLLAGPPTIGFLAERSGLPAALTTVSLLAAIGGFIAVLARRTEAGPTTQGSYI
ncbi:MAG TPA: MFS transporter [Solirubrobacteraceae bacterium]|nr:MFS transporter [Solirubrobacteraceae bacterium]